MSADRELLVMAAKAAGVYAVHEFTYLDGEKQSGPCPHGLWNRDRGGYWNPLADDGDALSVAVKLRMTVRVEDYGASARIDDKPHGAWSGCEAHLHGGIEAATRRAIVRAAAAIGEAML